MARKAGKDRLVIQLKDASDRPEVVYRLMRLLWTGSTGRGYDWNPNMSEEFNTARRKLDEAAKRINDGLENGDLMFDRPGEAARLQAEVESNRAFVAGEIGKKLRWAKWG